MPQDHGADLIAHVQSNNARLQCSDGSSNRETLMTTLYCGRFLFRAAATDDLGFS